MKNKCQWCGKTLEEHDNIGEGSFVTPKVPCHGLKSGFLEAKSTPPETESRIIPPNARRTGELGFIKTEGWEHGLRKIYPTHNGWSDQDMNGYNQIIDWFKQERNKLLEEIMVEVHQSTVNDDSDKIDAYALGREDLRKELLNKVNNFLASVHKDIPRIHPFHESGIIGIIESDTVDTAS